MVERVDDIQVAHACRVFDVPRGEPTQVKVEVAMEWLVGSSKMVREFAFALGIQGEHHFSRRSKPSRGSARLSSTVPMTTGPGSAGCSPGRRYGSVRTNSTIDVWCAAIVADPCSQWIGVIPGENLARAGVVPWLIRTA